MKARSRRSRRWISPDKLRLRGARHHDGGPIPLDWFRWRFDKAAEHVCMTGISPKTLRHTAGSLALGAGASVVTVQKLLGHRSPMTTMNVYSHMLPDDFDNLAKAMNKAARVAG